MGEKSKKEYPRKFGFSMVFTSHNLEVMKAAALSLAECPGSPWSPGGPTASAGNSVGGGKGSGITVVQSTSQSITMLTTFHDTDPPGAGMAHLQIRVLTRESWDRLHEKGRAGTTGFSGSQRVDGMWTTTGGCMK